MSNNPYPELIGALVSFECLDGSVYQGRLKDINDEERSIWLEKPFKDGKPLGEPIKLLGDTMKDLVVTKMPSPPPTPNMLTEEDLAAFITYEPSEEVQDEVDRKSNGKKAPDWQMANNKNNVKLEKRQKKEKEERKKEREEKQKRIELMKRLHESSTDRKPKVAIQEKPKQESTENEEQKPLSIGETSDSNSINAAFNKVFHNKEFLQEQSTVAKEEPRGMKSLLGQEHAGFILGKLKIATPVRETPKDIPKEAHKEEPMTSKSTSWYQNPLGFDFSNDSTPAKAPEQENKLHDAIKNMNIKASEFHKHETPKPKRQTFTGMQGSRGKFQPVNRFQAQTQVQMPARDTENSLAGINFTPSGQRPRVIEVAQALSAQRQAENAQKYPAYGQPPPILATSKPLPEFIRLSNAPEPQVKPGKRYFMEASGGKNGKNDKKNGQREQNQASNSGQRSKRVTVEQLLRQHRREKSPQSWEKSPEKLTFSEKDKKKDFKNKQERNAMAKSQRGEAGSSKQEREKAFDMEFFGRNQGGKGRKGGFVARVSPVLPKEMEKATVVHEEVPKVVEETTVIKEEVIETVEIEQTPKPELATSPEPTKAAETIAPSVANFFAQYTSIKQEFSTVDQPLTEVHEPQQASFEPPRPSDIPLPMPDLAPAVSAASSSAATNVAESVLSNIFEKLTVKSEIPPVVPDEMRHQESSAESEDRPRTPNFAADIEREDESTEEQESDTTESESESSSSSESEVLSESETSSTSSRVSGEPEQSDTDTEGSAEGAVPQPPPVLPRIGSENPQPALEPMVVHQVNTEAHEREASSEVPEDPRLAPEVEPQPGPSRAAVGVQENVSNPSRSIMDDPRIAEILKKWPYKNLPASSYRVDTGLLTYPSQSTPRRPLNQREMWFYDENGKPHDIKLNKFK